MMEPLLRKAHNKKKTKRRRGFFSVGVEREKNEHVKGGKGKKKEIRSRCSSDPSDPLKGKGARERKKRKKEE